jgi:hypothetical protein
MGPELGSAAAGGLDDGLEVSQAGAQKRLAGSKGISNKEDKFFWYMFYVFIFLPFPSWSRP